MSAPDGAQQRPTGPLLPCPHCGRPLQPCPACADSGSVTVCQTCRSGLVCPACGRHWTSP